jgi:hypothetical protein
LDALVSGPDDSSSDHYFFQPVGAPACNAAYRKKSCVQIGRYAQHFVYKTGIKIHVGTDHLVGTLYFFKNFRSKALNKPVQVEFVV